MKIIYIANIRLPTEKAHGIGRMKICEAFAKQGIEVELIHPWRFNKIKKDPFDYYGVKRNFRIKKLPHLDFIPLNKFLGSLASWIGSLEFSFISFCYILRRGFFKPNIVFFSHDHFPLFLFSFFSPNTFYDIHDFPRLKTFLHNLYYRRLFRRIKGITVTNLWKKEELKRVFKIEDEKILVAPNGVDLKIFNIEDKKEDYREEFNLPKNKKIIGYVGRLETMGKEKGIDTLVKAFKILAGQFNNLFLCIVGGPEKRIIEYKKFIKKLGIPDNKLKFLGQVQHSLVPKILRSCDILVMPYPRAPQYTFYMSPLKLFEYMTSQRPMVASDLPSLREILNENNAILVEPDNPKALTEGIKYLLENPDFSAKISNQAFQDVQKYSWENRAKNILNFICSKK